MNVADILKAKGNTVKTARSDTINNGMSVMSRERIRQLPAKNGEDLVGIVSIGDVLRRRLDEVQLEADVLRDYARVRR